MADCDQAAPLRIDPNVRIVLEDGLKLGAVLHLPSKAKACGPALMALTPYGAQAHHSAAAYFARHGYPFLTVDVRGRGESEGSFHPLNDASDGAEAAAWLARQPFCDGRIAMWGGSYLGHCQWKVAARAPELIRGITPTASPFYGIDVPLRNNIFPTYQAQWLNLVAGRTTQTAVFADDAHWRSIFRHHAEHGLPFRELGDCAASNATLFHEWLDHPELGDYWDQYNPSDAEYARLDIPVLTITGAYDGDQPGALEHYRRHLANAAPAAASRHHLLMGPWDHAGASNPRLQFCGIEAGERSLIDLKRLHLDWYNWLFGHGEFPALLADKVSYYSLGAEEWRHAPCIDAVQQGALALYPDGTLRPLDLLHSGGLTTDVPDRPSAAELEYDPTDTSIAALEAGLDPEDQTDCTMLLARSGQQFIFHSRPFNEPVEIAGFFRLVVWLSIDQPDADIQAEVWAVLPDGAAVRLSADWQRARYRSDARRARLVVTNEPLDYVFDRFTFTARRLPVGSRLRLVVAPINSIHQQRNYHTGGAVADELAADARILCMKLVQDPAKPSVLEVPLAAL